LHELRAAGRDFAHVVSRTEGPDSLGRRHQRQLREIDRLHGIKLEELPKSVQDQARRALR